MDRRLIRRIALLAVLLLVTIVMGTVGFHLVEGYPFFDAFYMTLITITTVGYQEIHPLGASGRLFNSFLILFGVSAMFFSVGALTQIVIEMQLTDRSGEGRKRRTIRRMNDHYIICGFGRVGRNAAHELQRAGAPFVVVDSSEQRVARAVEAGMTAILADATRDDSLRDAGIAKALGFIAALATDADNLYVILSARTLNPRLHIVTRASEEDAEQKLARAGADTVFSPYSIAGQRLAQLLIRPHVVQFLDFTTSRVGLNVAIEQICASPESELAGKTLSEMKARRELGVIVLAIRKPDGQMVFNPPAEARVASGDFLIVMGEQPSLRLFEKVLAGTRA